MHLLVLIFSKLGSMHAVTVVQVNDKITLTLRILFF